MTKVLFTPDLPRGVQLAIAIFEKGVFITTGTFTKAARDEASNAGKQQIDLIDGDEFIDKLIECRLGVKEKTVFEIDYDFFKSV